MNQGSATFHGQLHTILVVVSQFDTRSPLEAP